MQKFVQKHLRNERKVYLLIFFFESKFFLLNNFKLITEIEFSGLLLKLGKFVLIFGYFLQGRLDAVIT